VDLWGAQAIAKEFLQGYLKGVSNMGESGRWWEKLKDCPCDVDPNGDPPDGSGWDFHHGTVTGLYNWMRELKTSPQLYHPGAHFCMRTECPGKEKKVGQQCCYDTNGALITGGAAAGSPDRVCTCQEVNDDGNCHRDLENNDGHASDHVDDDVEPWKRLGWRAYAAFWKPNQGIGCPPNVV